MVAPIGNPQIVQWLNEASVILVINGVEEVWVAKRNPDTSGRICAISGKPFRSQTTMSPLGRKTDTLVDYESVTELPPADR